MRVINIQPDRGYFRLGTTTLGGRLVSLHGGVLDKSHKIRRYKRKDYTAVVDFPVEIIGRDGVVRRYSFEESIRLYQRRIASADFAMRTLNSSRQRNSTA